ncbi:MAG: tRNA (N6-threonylcarbamoyladenosine(37)-N6)-methyltransferase TrmO [Bacteriovoracaceae bacterium]|nr:tRNA (N6-threonylcarbamoyladenosine(37)-N6)-methyltransferase TrmO [Bacteriovoracaceae bacterium]
MMLEIIPIGHIHSAFPEKFGVPKQPGLAPGLKAIIELQGEWAHETCLKGIEECSHIWVLFHFHLSEPFKGGTVRPPILGGEKRMGVFSTRSPHRPNPIGLSLVKIEKILVKPGAAQIHVSGHDFVNGTPVFDIKPYVASYDEPQTPSHHWSDAIVQEQLEVVWRGNAVISLEKLSRLEEKPIIDQVLRLDPRPRNSKKDSLFGLSFAGLNISFRGEDDLIIIEDITLSETSPKIK